MITKAKTEQAKTDTENSALKVSKVSKLLEQSKNYLDEKVMMFENVIES